MSIRTAGPRPKGHAGRGLAGAWQLHPAAVCVLLLGAAFLLMYRLADVPPGLHVDAAIKGLDAQDVLNGQLSIFFPRNNGREALYIYYLAGLLAAGGTDRLVYGFAAISMGLLSVAVSYRLFKLLFGPAVAALTAGLLGISFWALYISRVGVRVTMLAPATVAPLYFLRRTLSWGRRRDALLGGICLGLSQYTYQPARFVPLLWLLLCLADWRRARKRAQQLATTAAIALLVFLPEGLYFARHPDVALQRASQVSVIGGNSSPAATLMALAQSTGATAGMFFVRGDWRPFQNLPFRPIFDPLLGALFCCGLLVALWRIRDSRYRWLLVWLVVMSLPSAITIEAPSNFRSYGAAPVTFVFPVLALVWLWRRLRLPAAAGLLAFALVGIEAYSSFNAYFQRWGPSREAAIAFDAHDSALAAFALEHPSAKIYWSDTRTLAGQPTRALVPATQRQSWYPEEAAAIPLPPGSGGDVLYAGSPRSTIGSLISEWLPDAQQLASAAADDSRGMWAFRWPSAAHERFLGSQRPSGIAFGQDLRLVSNATIRQGSQLRLNLAWQQLRPVGPYDLYTHVLDGAGQQLAQGDKLYFPVEQLGRAERFGQGTPTDDLILTQYSYALPPGHYTVEVGVVHRSPTDLGQLLAPAGPPGRLEIDV